MEKQTINASFALFKCVLLDNFEHNASFVLQGIIKFIIENWKLKIISVQCPISNKILYVEDMFAFCSWRGYV